LVPGGALQFKDASDTLLYVFNLDAVRVNWYCSNIIIDLHKTKFGVFFLQKTTIKCTSQTPFSSKLQEETKPYNMTLPIATTFVLLNLDVLKLFRWTTFKVPLSASTKSHHDPLLSCYFLMQLFIKGSLLHESMCEFDSKVCIGC
jgi:hypothetical protein